MLLPRTCTGTVHLDVIALVRWRGLLCHRYHRRVWCGTMVVDELHFQSDLYLGDAQVLDISEGNHCGVA